MLHPAQLYREELKRKLVETWYNPKYKWYRGGQEDREFTVPDTNEYRRDFVHLAPDGSVDGFFSYNYDKGSMSMTNFGLVSFSDDGADLVMDAVRHVKSMLDSLMALRVEFWAYVNNPASRFYNRIVAMNGGVCAGRLRNCEMIEGEFQDVRIYEILLADYLRVKEKRENAKGDG